MRIASQSLSGEDEEIMLNNSREVLEKGNKDKMMTEHMVQCSECGNTKFIRDYERAELTCLNCGLVIKDRMIDTGPEWRAFDHEQREKRARAGTPTTYTIHDKGLSTMIDWRNRDSFGKDLAPRKRAQIYRLRKWQRRIRVSDAMERNLAFALSELDRMASHLGLPRNVREASAVIYRKAVEQKLIRGRSIEGVAAAALYAACRQCKVPRTLDEITEVSRVSKKETGRSYRFIARELNIAIPPTNPVDYIPRFASQLNLSGEAQAKAVEILKHASMKGLTSGRGPTGVAAAAIYIASVALNERRTQRDVAEVARVTEVTVRNRYKELVEKLSL
jgi:transcription initiation factor TFIIB